MRPHRRRPTRLLCPGILQAKTLEWVAISFSNAGKWKVKVKSLSRVRLFATPWTAARQPPPSMGFPRQESWSGVPSPSPQSTVVLSLMMLKLQTLGNEDSSSWSFCNVNLELLPVFWCEIMILYLSSVSCPILESRYFSKEPWFFLYGNCTWQSLYKH